MSTLRNSVIQIASPGFLYATRAGARGTADGDGSDAEDDTVYGLEDDTVYGLFAAVVLVDARIVSVWKRLLRPLLLRRRWQQGAYQVRHSNRRNPTRQGEGCL
jgi:hypothetical protein